MMASLRGIRPKYPSLPMASSVAIWEDLAVMLITDLESWMVPLPT